MVQHTPKLEPLVRQDASEAKESVQDAKEFMEKVDKFFKMFSTAHDNYVRKLEEDTEEDDLENVLDTQFKYFDEVESTFISVRKLWNVFEQKVTEEVAAAAAAENQKKEAEKELYKPLNSSHQKGCLLPRSSERWSLKVLRT